MEGAPRVDFFAFGLDGFQHWARSLVGEGHTLIKTESGIAIRDCSVTPPTHWNRPFLAEVLKDSKDLGLKDAVLTHGTSYLADLPRISMFADHLPGLADGFASVHSEIDRLAKVGWNQMYTCSRLDEGKIDVPEFPARMVSQTAVDRKGASKGRFCRCADNGQPRRPRFTTGTKEPVPSLASACGWDEGKQLRKANEEKWATWLRHTPAFRRVRHASQVPPPKPQLVATSKMPSEVRRMAIAAGYSIEQVEQAVAQHALRPRFPPELKPLFVDWLLALCIIGYAAWLCGEPVLGLGDDEADCFHQFMSRLDQIFQCLISLLDPAPSYPLVLPP